MNNYESNETVINLREVIWDLLSQWKAVLIVALLMALLVAGAKHAKDTRAFNAAEAQQAADAALDLTAEERVAEILDALPESERSTVEYLANQNEWIEMHKEYVNNSILLNTNPDRQRTLILEYYVSIDKAAAAKSKILALVEGYRGYLKDEKLVASVGKAIDPEAEPKNITELIRSDTSLATDTNEYDVVSAGVLLKIYVVLPEGADPDAVEAAMTESLKKYSTELTSKIADHSLTMIRAIESYIYYADAVNNKNNTLYAINNLSNNTKNMMSGLSEEQTAALEEITALMNESDEDETSTETAEVSIGSDEEGVLTKPAFSKKYAVLGFALGVFAYAFAYLVIIILRGRLNSASDVQDYTRARLLGEVYYDTDRNGILNAMLHSKLVSKYRYHGKGDTEVQLNRLSDALDSAAKHIGAKEITLFMLDDSHEDSTVKNIVSRIIEKAADSGLKINVENTADDIEEKKLLSVENAAFVANSNTKAKTICNLASLCSNYDVRILGSAYVAEKQ